MIKTELDAYNQEIEKRCEQFLSLIRSRLQNCGVSMLGLSKITPFTQPYLHKVLRENKSKSKTSVHAEKMTVGHMMQLLDAVGLKLSVDYDGPGIPGTPGCNDSEKKKK